MNAGIKKEENGKFTVCASNNYTTGARRYMLPDGFYVAVDCGNQHRIYDSKRNAVDIEQTDDQGTLSLTSYDNTVSYAFLLSTLGALI